MGRKHLLTLLVTGLCCISAAHLFAATNPYIFYSDLVNGPNSGGQDGLGTIVTVYGNGFGNAQSNSYVTVGGGTAASYLSWSDKKIAFQLGPRAASGRIVVHVGKASSNGINFTVRSGNIRFVSVNGADAANGRYGSPWKTIARALRSLSAGDIVYVMDGVQQLTPDSNGAALSIATGGNGSLPIALVAYPGATVQIGSSTATKYAIYATSATNWVIAGMQIKGSAEALHLSRSPGWRIVAGDISCPNATGAGACIDASRSGSAKVLGNTIHDSGVQGSALAQFDALLFTYGNGITVAWNEISRTNGCRAVHVRNPGSYQSNLKVYDNWIHDSVCDAVSLDNVDASNATVRIYNNVIARAGTGPYPGSDSTFTCVSVGGSGNGSVQISNNTLHDCGAQGGANAGALAASTPTELDDTIVDLTAGEAYIATGTDQSNWSGSNNLFSGNSSVPGLFTATLSKDPIFIDATHNNYQLSSTSPAIDAGTSTSINRDCLGVVRPQNAAYDIGAFEFVGSRGTTASPGQLQATPTVVDFGPTNINTSSTQNVTVANTGATPVNVAQIELTGNGFSIPQPSGPTSIAPGASITIQIAFSPTAATSYTGNVTLMSDASNSSLQIPLSGNGTQPAQAQIAVSPTALAFGNVNTGSSKTQPVTITNTGNASATINQVGANGTGFSTSALATPYSLAAGAVLTIQVTFSPTSVTAYNGGLSITSDAPNSPFNVPLSGAGVQPPQAQLTVTPSAVTFGNVNTGTNSTQTITLKNAGNASATISQLSTVGAGFSTSGIAMPYTLAAGATVSLQVTFSPVSVTTYNGGLSIASDAPNSPLNVPLSGVGTLPPQAQLTVTPSSITFGSVNTGTSTAQTIALKNSGNASAIINKVSTTGAGFSVSGAVMPYTLAAGATLSLQITFSPSSATTYTGSLSVVSDAPNSPLNVPLSGTGTLPPQAQLAVTPSTLSFGNVTVGTNSTQVITLKNTGNASAIISQLIANGIGFSTSNLAMPYTLASGASVTLQVTFSPSSAIAYSGSLMVGSNAPNSPLLVPLAGTGTPIPQAQLSPNPASVNFGSVAVGSTATKTIALTNTGNASATISQINVNGTGFAAAGLTLPYALAAGATASFQVAFSPNAAGTYNATAVLVSTAGNSPTSIPLTGTGTITVSQHSVGLSWNDTDIGLSGYNVYRAGQTGGPYAKVNASLLGSTSWTDTSVQAGLTYYYVVTAVNASGLESGYSTEARAVIPTP